MRTKPIAHVDFLSPLSRIPGLGPRRRGALEEAGIRNVGDLLRYYPTRYVDRSNLINIGDACNFADRVVTVRGSVERARGEYFDRAKYRVTISDGSGTMDAVWYIRSMKIKAGETLILTGKVLGSRGKFLMIHPVMEKLTEKSSGDFRPILAVYSIREPMREARVAQKLLRKSIEWALKNVDAAAYPQALPAAIENRHGFPPLADCLRYMHLPEDMSLLDGYKKRLKYEELYKLALDLRWNRKKFALPGRAMLAGELEAKVREILPFELTESQERAIGVLYADAAEPRRMHRLLQGDVGSGKTVTALMASLPALNSGRQVAWMAPTEVLARQTKSVVDKYLGQLGIETGYLGAGDGPEKRRVLRELASGKLRFAVGTHALFSPSVRFKNLGLAIIDEQHKFGAAQRLKLQEKGAASDFLMMSATPIPQTLAKTLYGDLDVVEITSRPNRAPISTHIVPPQKVADMEKFILERIGGGSRVFYVAPRIENPDDDEGDDGDKKNIGPSTVDSVVEKLNAGPLSSVPIRKLHGQMSYEEREEAIAAFRGGPPGILVSTTIVEVGVDVPDATVMVIENPEYFGLAQLHQIRGRVGRGSARSYCFLLPGGSVDGNEASAERLKFLCGCNDGFKIAEWDLRHRGPGDAAGYRQSGWDDLCAADILEDSDMFKEILFEIEGLFEA